MGSPSSSQPRGALALAPALAAAGSAEPAAGIRWDAARAELQSCMALLAPDAQALLGPAWGNRGETGASLGTC